MKAFIIACVATIVIAVVGGIALNSVQETSANAFSTSSVRLGT